MRWLYRLQSHVGLSGPEGTAALVLFGALGVGMVVAEVRSAAEPIPADFYAAADATFAAAEAPAAPLTSATDRPAPLAAPLASSTSPDDPPGPETAAEVAEAEVTEAAAPRRASKPPPARTNINTASAADLQRLPGIGPALAGRIVAYRETNGPFRSPSQIVEVKGIGDKTFEKLSPWIHL